MGREVEAWYAWHASRHNEPRHWREVTLNSSTDGVWLTVEELAALKQELIELARRRLIEHLDRLDPANRPEGSRPVRFVAWAIPTGPPHTGSPAG